MNNRNRFRFIHNITKKFVRIFFNENKLFIFFFSVTTAISSTIYVGVVMTPACLDIYYPIENVTRRKMYIAQVDYYFFEADDYFFYVTAYSFTNAVFTIIAVTSPDLLLFTLCQHSYGMFKVLRFLLFFMFKQI